MAKSAGSCTPAGSFTYLAIGSGNNPNSFASGAVTCTQSGTTVVSSSGFFTPAMIGGIIKYGTGSGGTEQYITGYTSAFIITVSSSAIVSTPTVFTVWQVQQTALQTPLYFTNNYRTLTADNQTTYTTGTVIHQRTFINPAQSSSYNVNELGWQISATGASLNGRIVLSSTDVVSPSDYYLVVMTLSISYSPSTPLSVGNVGTGFNSSGKLMIEYFSTATVNSDGTTSLEGCLDSQTSNHCTANAFITTYSQAGSVGSATPPVTGITVLNMGNGNWTYAGSIGLSTITLSQTSSHSAHTCFGFGLTYSGLVSAPCLDILLTSTFSTPTAFNTNSVWSCLYSRTLVN